MKMKFMDLKTCTKSQSLQIYNYTKLVTGLEVYGSITVLKADTQTVLKYGTKS